MRYLKANIRNGVPEVSVEEVSNLTDKVKIIDVRELHEYQGELGHIAGAQLVTLGPNLLKVLQDGNRDDEIVFVCRSGVRSEHAALASLQMGYKSVANMVGGMLKWNELKFPIEK